MRETLSIPLIIWTLWAIIAGIFWSYIYYQKLNSAVGGISHASLGGIWIGYFLFSSPIYGAYLFAPLLWFLLGYISLNYKQNKDAIISLIWSGGMSLGILLGYLSGNTWLEDYLFGNIFSTTSTDIWILWGLLITCLLFFGIFRKILKIISYDIEFARVQKLPYTFVYYGFMILLSLVIVALTKVIGIILILAIFSLPTLISISIKKTLSSIIWSNIFIGIITIGGGSIGAYYLNIPASPLIVGILILCYIISLLMNKKRRFN